MYINAWKARTVTKWNPNLESFVLYLQKKCYQKRCKNMYVVGPQSPFFDFLILVQKYCYMFENNVFIKQNLTFDIR